MDRNVQLDEVVKKTGIQQIQKTPKYFIHTYVLGVVNGQKITVADMLQAIVNAMRFVKANFDVNQEKYAETIKFLKASKAFFENKQPKDIRRETLHFVVDVFHEMEDMRAISDMQKKENEKISSALDLLINIFIKE